MKNAFIAVLATACCAFAATASADIERSEFLARRLRINADYQLAQQHCSPYTKNARDVCLLEAKGQYDVAKAELQAQYHPSRREQARVERVKAEAAYKLAREKCDDLVGSAKKECNRDARAAFIAERSEAPGNLGDGRASRNAKF